MATIARKRLSQHGLKRLGCTRATLVKIVSNKNKFFMILYKSPQFGLCTATRTHEVEIVSNRKS